MLGKLGFHFPPCLPRQTWPDGQAGLHPAEAVMGQLMVVASRFLLWTVGLLLVLLVPTEAFA
jgi:hypothetical protein